MTDGIETDVKGVSGHGKLALVREILRTDYGTQGPKGINQKRLLDDLNNRAKERGADCVSQSTLRRALRKEYGWGRKR